MPLGETVRVVGHPVAIAHAVKVSRHYGRGEVRYETWCGMSADKRDAIYNNLGTVTCKGCLRELHERPQD